MHELRRLLTAAAAIHDFLLRRMSLLAALCVMATRDDGGNARNKGVRAPHLRASDCNPPRTPATGVIVANMSADADRWNVPC